MLFVAIEIRRNAISRYATTHRPISRTATNFRELSQNFWIKLVYLMRTLFHFTSESTKFQSHSLKWYIRWILIKCQSLSLFWKWNFYTRNLILEVWRFFLQKCIKIISIFNQRQLRQWKNNFLKKSLKEQWNNRINVNKIKRLNWFCYEIFYYLSGKKHIRTYTYTMKEWKRGNYCCWTKLERRVWHFEKAVYLKKFRV